MRPAVPRARGETVRDLDGPGIAGDRYSLAPPPCLQNQVHDDLRAAERREAAHPNKGGAGLPGMGEGEDPTRAGAALGRALGIGGAGGTEIASALACLHRPALARCNGLVAQAAEAGEAVGEQRTGRHGADQPGPGLVFNPWDGRLGT